MPVSTSEYRERTYNGFTTEVERTYNGGGMKLYRCVCLVTVTMLPLPLVEFLWWGDGIMRK